MEFDTGVIAESGRKTSREKGLVRDLHIPLLSSWEFHENYCCQSLTLLEGVHETFVVLTPYSVHFYSSLDKIC
jgi:hypothetical protein